MATSSQQASASASAPASGSSQAQSSSNDATTSSSNSPTTSPSTTPTTTPTTAPTSASPTTTTPVGNTTPTTSPTGGQTTTSSPAQANSGSSTGSPATTTAPTTESSITFTSQVATTFLSTNSEGSVVVYTSTVPEVVATTISTTISGQSGSSHTGVIVGSVVGGLAGLALIVLLFFCIRRRVRNDEFDGNFDPDHVGGRTEGTSGATLPQVDFADDVAAVTPFPHPDNGSMRQYGETPYLALPSSPGTSGQFSSEFYGHGMQPQPQPFIQPGLPPSSYIPPVNPYGVPSEWSSRTSPPPPSTVSNRTSSARAAKEREAVGRQAGALGLATQAEAGEGSGEVVVHEDAGRAPSEEQAPPREIPPSYDSIRQN